jgi:hypothetical protein
MIDQVKLHPNGGGAGDEAATVQRLGELLYENAAEDDVTVLTGTPPAFAFKYTERKWAERMVTHGEVPPRARRSVAGVDKATSLAPFHT